MYFSEFGLAVPVFKWLLHHFKANESTRIELMTAVYFALEQYVQQVWVNLDTEYITEHMSVNNPMNKCEWRVN